MKRLKHLEKDDEGVSEVLGSILTLAITVILFLSIWWGVWQIQPPEEKNYTKFQLSYEVTTNQTGDSIFYINITNNGGDELEADRTDIVMMVENQHYRYSFSDDINNDLSDDKWSIGDTFNLRINKTHPGIYDEYNNSNSKISGMIINTLTDTIIWQEVIKKPGEYAPIVRERGVEYKLNWEKSAEPGDTVKLYANILDKDTRSVLDVSVNLTELDNYRGLGYNGSLFHMNLENNYKPFKENKYVKEITLKDKQENGSYLLKILASDGEHITDTQYIVLNVGEISFSEKAELKVDSDKIVFSPTSPINGDEITVTSTIYNTGGGPTDANVKFFDKNPNGTEYEAVNKTISFPAGGGRDVKASWKIRDSGLHTITVDALNVTDGLGDKGHKNISVSPKILLVDDDKKASGHDDSTAMRNALESSDITFDYLQVGSGNGPDYDDKLIEYDLVIWMTGSTTKQTITNQDRNNLETFLNENNKLWLIGDGILQDTSPGLEQWLEDYLHIKEPISVGPTQNVKSPLKGNAEPLSQDDRFYIDEEVAKNTDFRTPTDGNEMLLDGDNRTVAVSYNSTEQGGERTVFQPMLFKAINESKTAGRSRLAYEVILWLGNISKKSGVDVALSHQEFDNPSPEYQDEVTITGIVRNNGLENITTEAILEVDGKVEVEKRIENLGGKGSTTQIEFNWIADEVGLHNLKIIVDPYNKLEETNELNNDITYQGVNTTLDVRFTTLIVDDDGPGNSTEKVINQYEDLGYVYDVNRTDPNGPTVEEMKYFNSIVWVTGEETSNTLTEIDQENITRYLHDYSAGFFLIGDGVIRDLRIHGYNNFLENILKVGTSSLNAPDCLYGINNNTISHGMRYFLRDNWNTTPSYYNNLGKSKSILEDSKGRTYAHSWYDSLNDSSIIHMGIDLMHFKHPYDSSRDEKQWYDEYNFNVSPQSMREEFVYMANRFLGKSDDRVELRVGESDIIISNKHPMLGNSYGLRATIHNAGGTGSNALVRFKDGSSHIDTESLFVPAGGSAEVEIKWNPLHADNNRPIRIIVDPIKEVAEIPNEVGDQSVEDHLSFNNQAIKYTPVYYFWDDMENGSSNWNHEANLALINGETSIDYMGGQYDKLDTNVAGDWSESEGVEVVEWDSHSDPSSFFMEEPTGLTARKADVLISFAIDDSASMSERFTNSDPTKSWLEAAKDAAKTLLEQLSNDSVCVSIWDYKGNNERRWSGPTDRVPNDPATDTVIGRNPVRLGDDFGGINGKEKIRQEIDAMNNPSGTTILWDSIGEAYLDTQYYADQYPDLKPTVVVLSDGADSQASDRSSIASNRIEGGSDYWCPWGDEDNGTQYYEFHRGKYTFDWSDPMGSTQWLRAMDHGGSMEHSRVGLLNPEMQIFTVGLGVEHHEPPYKPTINTWPGEVNDYTNALCTDTSVTPPCKESGTLEYNLWRIANTSDAMYFHAPDGDDLEGIFEEIGQYLSGPENLSSINPGDVIKSENNIKEFNPNPSNQANSNKWAVTPTIDLRNISSAWMTFWQKYRIIQGVNGGFLEVGYYNDTNDEWMWKYIKPSIGPYNGNLFIESLPYDDFGNEIRWCWNGKSSGGTMDWEFVKVNILKYLKDLNDEELDQVRMRFYYKQYGGSTVPGGWLIDDVSITTGRRGDKGNTIMGGTHDVWQMRENITDRKGDLTTAWWNGEPSQQAFRAGIDDRLITTPIDLTNAKTANLSAYFKFNINNLAGRPPDGFRVEISTDRGVSWDALNIGVRTASGVSGTSSSNYWTSAGGLSRLNVDLSDFSGNAILLRFRVVTNSDNSYDNYQDDSVGFGGFYVDDVVISGETIQG